MAPYSVIGRDDEPDDDPDANLSAPAVLSYRRPASADEPLPRHAPRESTAPQASPEVVLQLPDLSAAGGFSGDGWSSIGNRLFWVGIILGSLVALVLIWSPSKPAVRKIKEAPAPIEKGSSNHAAPSSAAQAQTSAPAWQQNAAQSPAVQQPAAIQPAASRPAETELDAPPPGHEAAPSFDDFGTRSSPPPALRTAQGSGSTKWDGVAPRVKPGEAAPTGKIINTLVNE